MAEEHKSWWQTAAGLMTGVAALISALTALILALHQIKKDSEEAKRPAVEQPASSHGPLSVDHPKVLPPSGRPVSTPASTVAGGARTTSEGGQRQDVSASRADRPTYALQLPRPHEFALGTDAQTSQFILTAARLEPHTATSDILKISVQVLVDGQLQFPFNNSQFELRIDEQPYRSTTSFNEFIPVGQSRDHDLHFTIPHGSTRAVLWIHERLSNAEVPLDLTARN
jgi:hypothetical protein